jgi:hypothetical protein
MKKPKIPSRPSLSLLVLFSVIVTSFGFLVILMLACWSTKNTEAFAWRKPVAGSIFALICVVGILLAMSPRRLLEIHDQQKRMEAPLSTSSSSSLAFSTKGHHYDCDSFSAHTLVAKGHVLCAACTGLSLGAIAALFGTTLYFFLEQDFLQMNFFVLAIGMALVGIGFFQFKFGGFARMIFNVLFVLGAFLVLVGIDGLKKSLLVDLFSIFIIIFWIFTRIILSQRDHINTCRRCQVACEASTKHQLSK